MIKGRFTSGDGSVIGGRVVDVMMRLPSRTQSSVKSAADGTFVINGVPADASGTLYVGEKRGEFVHASGPDKGWKSPDQENAVVFRHLAVGSYDAVEINVSKTVHVKGIVRDQDGKPAEKAMVEVVQTRSIYTANAKGEYDAEIPTVEPADLKVINDNGFEEAGTVRVTAQAGKVATQDLVGKRRVPEVANGVVSGQVVDEAGNPVAKAAGGVGK